MPKNPALRPDGGFSKVGLLAASFLVGLVVAGAVFGIARWMAISGTKSIVELKPGDCFVLPISGDQTALNLVTVVDCDQPHDTEVIERGELNPNGDLAYPPEAELIGLVDIACGDPRRFHDVGFGVLPVSPTEATWHGRAGTYVCLAITIGDQLVEGRQIKGAKGEIAVIASAPAWAIGSVG